MSSFGVEIGCDSVTLLSQLSRCLKGLCHGMSLDI